MQDIPLIVEGQKEIPLNEIIRRLNALCKLIVTPGEAGVFTMNGDKAVLKIEGGGGDGVRTYLLEDIEGVLTIRQYDVSATPVV